MGCDDEHDYQPSYRDKIVDSCRAGLGWEAFGVSVALANDNWPEGCCRSDRRIGCMK